LCADTVNFNFYTRLWAYSHRLKKHLLYTIEVFIEVDILMLLCLTNCEIAE